VRSQLPERSPAGNLFRLPGALPEEELVERIAGGADVLVERIVSTGQATAPGEWLEQERDEWVVLLEGEAGIGYEDGSQLRLRPGDYVLIPAGERHRVEWTRDDPPCIWLAVHAPGLGR
jgi:cupin 2 domain-containing protein